jgi:3-hydroxyisobutyrate dehydrogenase-like beta-hydroxyacid dehydrogenase
MAKIAFIGTGLIGSGMVEAARRRGDEVAVYNRTRRKAEALASTGASVAASPAEAVRGVERVHFALADDAALDAVLPAVLPALSPGALLLDHTTASPKGTALRAERLAAKGAAYLHCPIFMSPQHARDAQGLMLVSGPRALYERAAPALSAMTGEAWYLGERTDLAAAYKLFGNAMILTIVGGLADVFQMASGLGISAPDAHALFSKFKPGFTIDVRGARMARGEFSPAFTMQMALKDVRLMEEAASGRPLDLLPALAAAMERAIKDGRGELDVGALGLVR